MKKLFALISVAALSLVLAGCGSSPQVSGLGSTVEVGDFEVTVTDVTNAPQLNFDTSYHDEFMTEDLSVGRTVDVAKDGYTLVSVSYTVKNVGSEEATFDDKVILVYDKEYEYESDEQYYTTSDPLDSWSQFTNGGLTYVDVAPLATIECKAYLSVPSEVFDNADAPLQLTLGDAIYAVR